MELVLTVTEAARNFADVVNRAYYRHEGTLLMRGREAVARISPVGPDVKTGRDIAKNWRNRAPLDEAEAANLAEDVEKARTNLPTVTNPWD